jgi:putative FmdB family regulatory protein
MPTYEYSCHACGHEFEREQRITEDPIKKCPACGKQKARRNITQGNFILKGGGWYSDLYSGPSNQKKDDAQADSGSGDGASKSDSAEGGSSESKGGDSSSSSKKEGESSSKSSKSKTKSSSTAAE